jgi:hypothetical protein
VPSYYVLTIGCTATGFPLLRSYKPAREPGVIPKSERSLCDRNGCSIFERMLALIFSAFSFFAF